MTLRDYFAELQSRERFPFVPLIEPWPAPLRADIERAFRAATAAPLGYIGGVCAIAPSVRNQAVGNRLADHAVATLSPLLGLGTPLAGRFRIQKCGGRGGYPDGELIDTRLTGRYSLEFKATSQWNPADQNRVVLTSSSKRLRTFTPPIFHLLVSISYTRVPAGARLDALRLNFLDPATDVEVRLEASSCQADLSLTAILMP